MQWIVGGKAASGAAGSPSQMGASKRDGSRPKRTLSPLVDLSGQWIDPVRREEFLLDMRRVLLGSDQADGRLSADVRCTSTPAVRCAQRAVIRWPCGDLILARSEIILTEVIPGELVAMSLRKKTRSALLSVLILMSGRKLCDLAQANDSSQSWPTNEWQTSTPEEQGMDSAALAQLVDFVGIYKQDSLLIIRHGKIVVDAYYAPYVRNIRHDLRSVTKSFISTLTGIEVQEGLLDSVDHPIVDLFTDKHISNLDDGKKAITVQNMLDMTSGIAWSEDAYTHETIIRMYKTPDPTEFVLSQPMSDPPGTRFYYNGGNPYVLSALITKTAGRDAWISPETSYSSL